MYPTDASEAPSFDPSAEQNGSNSSLDVIHFGAPASSIAPDVEKPPWCESLEETTVHGYAVVSRAEKGPRVRCSPTPDNASPLSTIRAGANRPASGQTGPPQDKPAAGQMTGKSRADLEAIVELIKEHGLSSGGGGGGEGRPAVFVLGNTGAGKSLFINFLAGRNIVQRQREDEDGAVDLKPIVDVEDPLDGFKVGHAMDSETKHLHRYLDDARSLVVFDTPGFGDTQGTTIDIANSIAVSSTIRACSSVRFVVLVEADALGHARGASLKALFDLLARFLNGAENYKESLLFLFSKTDSIVNWRRLEECLKECAKASHFREAAPLLEYVIDLVRTHKTKLLLKPSAMTSSNKPASGLPDKPASGLDRPVSGLVLGSLRDDVWSLIEEDLIPITDIENAVRFPLNAASGDDLVIACEQLARNVEGGLRAGGGMDGLHVDDLDRHLDVLKVLASAMYNTDVSAAYARVVSLLGDVVWDNLRRSEEGLSQQRFAKTAEGMEGVSLLGAVLSLHDEEAASDSREREQGIKREINRVVRDAGGDASRPEASCGELRGALDTLQSVECTLKSFLTAENCRAYSVAVTAVRERFQGRYEAVQAMLAGMEAGAVDDSPQSVDAFQDTLDELRQFPLLESHVAWTHSACHEALVARISSTVHKFSAEFLSKLETSEGLDVEEFNAVCLGLQTAVSVLRFAARLDANVHHPDATGGLDASANGSKATGGLDACIAALDAFILLLFCGVDEGVGGNEFEGVASSLGKLLLIASTLKPHDALFEGQCAGKRAFIVNHLHGLVATVSADLDWFTTKPWGAPNYKSFAHTVSTAMSGLTALSVYMEHETSAVRSDLCTQWDRVITLQLATAEAAERALPTARMDNDQSLSSDAGDAPEVDPDELLRNMARLQAFLEVRDTISVSDNVEDLCRGFLEKLTTSFAAKSSELLTDTASGEAGAIKQGLEVLRAYTKAFRAAMSDGETFSCLFNAAMAPPMAPPGSGAVPHRVAAMSGGALPKSAFEALVATVEVSLEEAVATLKERAGALEVAATQRIADGAFEECSTTLDALSAMRDELDGRCEAGGAFGAAYAGVVKTLKEKVREDAAACEEDIQGDRMQAAQERLRGVAGAVVAQRHVEEAAHTFERLSGVFAAKTSKFNAQVHLLLMESKWRPLALLLRGHSELVESTPGARAEFSQAKVLLLEHFRQCLDAGVGIVQGLNPSRALSEERLQQLAFSLNKFAAAGVVFGVFGEEESENEFLQMSAELNKKFHSKVSGIYEKAALCVRKLDFRGFEATSLYLRTLQEEIRVVAGDIGEQLSGLDDAMAGRLQDLQGILLSRCQSFDFREIDKIFTAFDRAADVDMIGSRVLEDERFTLEKVLESVLHTICVDIERCLNSEDIKGAYAKIEDFRKLLCSKTVQTTTRYNNSKLQTFEREMESIQEEIFSVRSLKADPERTRECLAGIKQIDNRFYKRKCHQFLDALHKEQEEVLKQVEARNEGVVKTLNHTLNDLDLFERVLEGHEEVGNHKARVFDCLTGAMDKVHRQLQAQIQRGEWDDVSTHWGFFLAGCELLRSRAFPGLGDRQEEFVRKFTDVAAKLGRMHSSLEKSRKFVDALSLRTEICLEELGKVMAFYFKHSHFHKTQFGDASEGGQEVSFQTIVKTLNARIKAAADEVPGLWALGDHTSIVTILTNMENLATLDQLSGEPEKWRVHVCGLLHRELDVLAGRAEKAFARVAEVSFQEHVEAPLKEAKDSFGELQRAQLPYANFRDVASKDHVESVLQKAMEESSKKVDAFSLRAGSELEPVADLVWRVWALPCEVNNTAFFEHACACIRRVFSRFDKKFNYDALADVLTDRDAKGGEIVAQFKEFEKFRNARFRETTARMTPEDSLKMLVECNKLSTGNVAALKTAFAEQRTSWESVLRTSRDVEAIARKVADMKTQGKSIATLLGGIFGLWSKLRGQLVDGEWERPHPVQLLAIFRMLGVDRGHSWRDWAGFSNNESKGHVVELKTGEGKSLVLGAVAAFLGLEKFHVDVVSYSKYLSERDGASFRAVFEALGVADLIVYGTFGSLANGLINAGGDVRDLTKQLINSDMKAGMKVAAGARDGRKKVLLLDEMDVIFANDFYGQTYNPVACIQNAHVEEIQRYIWANRSKSSGQLVQEAHALDGYKKLSSKFAQSLPLIDGHIVKMCQHVRRLPTHSYLVKDGQIGYKASDLSIATNMRYGYMTVFAAFQERERGALSEDTLARALGVDVACGNFSYAEMSDGYDRILGVTGTLQSLGNQEKKVIRDRFRIRDQTLTPSIYGVSNVQFRTELDVHVEGDDALHHRKIREEIVQTLGAERSILVFFKDDAAIKAWRDAGYAEGLELEVVTQETDNIDHFVKQAARASKATLFSRIHGRGIDFVSHDKALEAKGGIHVVQTFLSEEYSEEVQIKGRTARQGKKGSFALVLNAKDLVHFDISEEEIDKARNAGTLYDLLHTKRNAFFAAEGEKREATVRTAKALHDLSFKYKQKLLEFRANMPRDKLNKASKDMVRLLLQIGRINPDPQDGEDPDDED